MRIESIEMTNFRQYIGTQKIEFSQDKDQNVTVLIGKNTSGKTTLIRAFEWCLYRKNRFEDQILLNSEVAERLSQNQSTDVKVSLVMWHNQSVKGEDTEVRYKITREATYLCTGKKDDGSNKIILSGPLRGRVECLNDEGQTISEIDSGSVNASITRILPEDLSDYFFLTGERIAEITTSKDLKESVRGLMGLDVLDNTRKHLKMIINTYNASLKKSGNVNVEMAQNALETKQKQLESKNKEIDEVQDSIEFYQNEKAECAAKLKENDTAIKDQQKREQLEKIIKGLKDSSVSDKQDVVNAFSGNAYSFFLKPLAGKVEELMDRYASETECVPDMTQTSIDYIINKRKRCICGTMIDFGSAAYQNLMTERKKMPPEAIGSIASRYKSYTAAYSSAGDNFFKTLESTYKVYRRDKKDLGLRILEKENIDKSLGKDDIDVAVLNNNYKQAVKMLDAQNRKLRDLCAQQGSIQKEIDNYQKAINEYLKSDSKNERLRRYMAYTRLLFDWINTAYNQKELSIRSMLEMKVNANFKKMYHGNRAIVIDSKYQVKYLDVKLDESDGLRAVKNFAFVSGLVDLAKEALQGDEDDVDMGTQTFPLVMDAPFSNIDEIHISNICSILPSTAEQVIIAVMQKDWEQAEDKLEGKIGKKYFIEKDTDGSGNEIETATHIVEVEV